MRLHTAAGGREVQGAAWGPGAEWALDALPGMLGGDDAGADDFAAAAAGHPFLRQALRRHPHWRVPRSGLVFEAMLAAVLEQKVTGQEARPAGGRCCCRFGDPAPGPGAQLGLRVTPAPETVRMIPSWEWLRMPVDPARSRAAVVTAPGWRPRWSGRLALAHAEAERVLRTLPGIGEWTAAEVRQRAHGDPDAASFGDYHVPASIGMTLTGEPVDDAGSPSCSSSSGRTGTGCSGWSSCAASGSRAADRGWPPRRHLPGRYAGRSRSLPRPRRPVHPDPPTLRHGVLAP